ncbi:MAG TPA: hypothetical protein VFR97_12060 [Capillimicrobium sp.]|nr:hypothetical protein [Capillimicrobium sp.]
MPRHPLHALAAAAVAAAATLATAAPASAAADPVIAVDVIAKHTVVWDFVEEGYPDDCRNWVKGSGTQTIRVRSDRRERLRLDRAFGKVFLSAERPGTFEGGVERVGRWKVNVPPNTQPCSPCGPLSEFGECDDDPQPPKPLQFQCGERQGRYPLASIGYRKATLVPDLAKGLTVAASVTFKEYENCPPTIPRATRAWLHFPSPAQANLPQEDTKRIARLQPGDSVVSEVTVERTYVDDDKARTTKEGDRCLKLPKLTAGYTECAVTEYSVTFTRIR